VRGRLAGRDGRGRDAISGRDMARTATANAEDQGVPVIFKRKQKVSDLGAVISELEQAVDARDGARTERAFTAASKSLRQATDTELVLAGPRLAALLPAFPPVGPRPLLASAAGFCVESGADPAACAEPVLGGAHRDLLDALELARRWTAVGGAEDELPEPDEKIIDDALLARWATTLTRPGGWRWPGARSRNGSRPRRRPDSVDPAEALREARVSPGPSGRDPSNGRRRPSGMRTRRGREPSRPDRGPNGGDHRPHGPGTHHDRDRAPSRPGREPNGGDHRPHGPGTHHDRDRAPSRPGREPSDGDRRRGGPSDRAHEFRSALDRCSDPRRGLRAAAQTAGRPRPGHRPEQWPPRRSPLWRGVPSLRPLRKRPPRRPGAQCPSP
jgi:hypothetical protein